MEKEVYRDISISRKDVSTNTMRVVVGFGIAVVAMAVLIIVTKRLGMDPYISLIISLAGILIYLVVAYLIIKVSNKEEIRKISVPKEYEYVEKPVYHVMEKSVKVPVYIKEEKPEDKYKFVASVETGIYQLAKSRHARLIKEENRVYTNDEEQLLRKGYKPSKILLRERRRRARKSNSSEKILKKSKKKNPKKESTQKKKKVKKKTKSGKK